MKHLLLTTIAAVLLVGCGEPSNPAADRALLKAAELGNIEAVKQHLAAGADVNANNKFDSTPLDWAITSKQTETADLLRKHGGKTGEELKAQGK
jgi:ankyrin repeat protein